MAKNLQGIPGVGGGRHRRRPPRHNDSWGDAWGEVPDPRVLGLTEAPRKAVHRPARPVKRRTFRPFDRVPWSTVAIGLGCVAVGIYVCNLFWSATRVEVHVEGISDGMSIMPRVLAGQPVTFRLDPHDRIDRTRFRVDGQPVPDDAVETNGDTITWKPGWMDEGRHHITLAVPRPPMLDSKFDWRVNVDNTPPDLDVQALQPAAALCSEVTISGEVEKGAALTVDGRPVDHNGTFSLRYGKPPAEPLKLVAVDAAGNQAHAEVIVPIRYPGGQGVHVTAAAWAHEPLRKGILDLIDARLVSVVELDLKDEGGMIGYDTKIPLAHQVGAASSDYRMKDALSELKRRNVRVVGRLVAFRDPTLAEWAWANNKRDMVVQTDKGAPLPGGFTNLFHPEVRKYNLDVAVEAVSMGVDDVLWDYMRRPEGDPAVMRIPLMPPGVTSADAVVTFLKESETALHDRCAFQGVSVFGIAADRPDAVGQDVPRIARTVDYIAPMLYPSHWTNGEYGVKNPNAQPFDIIKATLADFQAKTAGTGTTLVPWLQDFSLGVTYGPNEVRAQIDASAQLGIKDWLLWNPGVRYTAAALQPSLVTIRS
ncbi:MAG: putative glycoside hydrolase [Acidimicrobiales bacterium]